MGNKRLQLFMVYSMGLISILTIFSVSIYFSVSISEETRITANMQTKLSGMLESDRYQVKSLDELQTYAYENKIDYAIWYPGQDSPYKKNSLFLTWTAPTSVDRLEKLWAQQQFTTDDQFKLVPMYSYSISIRIDGKAAQLQIVESMEESNAMLSNLTNVLFFGTVVVSVLGTGLGIMLSYLNMLPIIHSWNQQRTFVADASHELRTPLSIITLKSDQLITHSSDTVYDHIEEVAVIQQECRRMHKMVDDLLFLAKSDSGVIDMQMADFSVKQLGNELKLLYDEFFEIEDKEFILDIQSDDMVVGDYEKIKQVCMIIIDNGLRFTTEGDYIKLSIKSRGNRVHFDITNNGVPLKAEEIPFIFNRFYKSDTSRNKSNEKEGNGLGLSIAQQIIISHQNRIRAYVQHDITGFNFSLAKARKNNQHTDKVILDEIDKEEK